MRFLLVLTALMLAVAAGVWWKTTQSGDTTLDPLDTDPNLGVATFGTEPERSGPVPAKEPTAANASLTREPPTLPQPAGAATLSGASAADAVQPGSTLVPAGGGDPKEPQGAANERAAAKPPAAAGAASSYTVKDGDTLYRIVLRAYGTAPQELVDAVAKSNGLRDASQLGAGRQLTLPSLAGWPAPKKP